MHWVAALFNGESVSQVMVKCLKGGRKVERTDNADIQPLVVCNMSRDFLAIRSASLSLLCTSNSGCERSSGNSSRPR